MKLFLEVVMRYNIHPAFIFRMAYDYYEVRVHKENLVQVCMKHFHYTEDKSTIIVDSVPEMVESYCLDLLAGRTKMFAILEGGIK